METKRFVLTLFASFIVLVMLSIIGSHMTGFAIFSGGVGTDSDYVDGFIKDDNTVDSTAVFLRTGDDGAVIYRSFIDFNISSIPDTALIHNVSLNLTIQTQGAVTMDFWVLSQSADSRIDASEEATLYAECGGTGSNLTLDDSTAFSGESAGTTIEVQLDTDAETNLQNNLGNDVFSICIQSIDEASYLGNEVRFHSLESATADYRPLLIVNYTDSDSTPPEVTIVNPQNSTYGIENVSAGIEFNVTLSESGVANYSIGGGAVNETMNTTDNLNFWDVNDSLSEGSYAVNFYTSDDSSNRNDTESVVFSVDLTRPGVNITSPADGVTYTSNTYGISVNTTENSTCSYTLDSGSTNTSLTVSAGGRLHSATVSGAANGVYTLIAYCYDLAGNSNTTQNISYTISVSTDDDTGGGGGGGCDEDDWSCGDWGDCINGTQTRTCINDCDDEKNESQSCEIIDEVNETVCENQCSEEGTLCNGNSVETCQIVEGCYKIVNIEECVSGELCLGGQCVVQEKESVFDDIGGLFGGSGSGAGSVLKKIPKPSDFIPHGNIPDVVVDAGSGAAVVGGASWLGWLWLLTLIPFFLRKLRHYSVSIIDTNDKLGLFNKKKNKKKLMSLLKDLNKNYGRLVPATKDEEVVKYLVEEGFIELRLDEPLILMGHFTDKKKVKEFEKSLMAALKREKIDIEVMRSVEVASMFRVIRSWWRERKSKKMIKKEMKKR